MKDLMLLTKDVFLINLIVIFFTIFYGMFKLLRSFTFAQVGAYGSDFTDNLIIGITNLLISLICLAYVTTIF